MSLLFSLMVVAFIILSCFPAVAFDFEEADIIQIESLLNNRTREVGLAYFERY